MRMYDIIEKKRDGKNLKREEIQFVIDGYLADEIPDYQVSALLMAVFFQGMTDEELGELTQVMAESGDIVDLSAIEGVKADKHSTGGVGDKTTLIAAPIVAACGVKVAKMSGRGLGHTGGTVDKLEAIPGFCTDISREQFFSIVNKIGVSLIGQSGNLAPADKKLYALRDVTATVESIPLIAASIMSKKLAAGSDCILLDVKTGSGAFMKTVSEAAALAQKMTAIGAHAGKRTAALITDMDVPLGACIGNSLEVIESVAVLQGKGPEDLTEVSLELAANMLHLAGQGELVKCRRQAKAAIEDGSALQKFEAMVAAQGGDVAVIRDTGKFPAAAYQCELVAEDEGYITGMDAQACGTASGLLGAARETKESSIDYGAGIVLKKKTGMRVSKGEVLAVLATNDKNRLPAACNKLKKAYTISDEVKDKKPLILARVDENGISEYTE